MASINIDRSNPDLFYRYKMPKLLAKVEGRGNGVKTVIPNMSEIAEALERPPEYPTKYFGIQLGAQTQMDAKADRYIVNGTHDAETLQDLLDGFIRTFVLCKECDNPETKLEVDKESIWSTCAACGARYQIKDKSRLVSFIVKHPPPSDAGGGKDAKKEKHADKAKSILNENEKKAKKLREADEKDDDHEWSIDTSEEAVKARRDAAMTTAVAKIALDDNIAEMSEKQRLDKFFTWLRADKRAGKDMVAEAERLEIRDKAVRVVAEVLLTEDIVNDLQTNRAVLLRFTNDSPKAQKYLLGALEQIVGVAFPKLIPKMGHILKTLYDLDIVEEGVLLKWDDRASTKYVADDIAERIHAAAAAFMQWLKEAEVEDSDDDGGDDENENESPANGAASPAINGNGHADGDVADDIDIDNI